MALAGRLQPFSGCRRRTLQPWATLLLTYGSILLLLLSFHCVNGQYSPYNEHAKYPSLFRSSAAAAAARQTAVVDKDGGSSGEAETAGVKASAENTGEPGSAGPKQWTSFAEGADNFNVNLDIGLMDVEPEANLFLDETPLLARAGSSTNQKQKLQGTTASSSKNNAFDGSSVLETRHLALVHSASSVVVRATYGPFTARQTINPFSAPKNTSSSANIGSSSWSAAKELKKSTTTKNSRPLSSSSSSNRNSNFLLSPEQITAYLVTKEVRRSHPVLRVLFYASHLAEYRSHVLAQSSILTSEEDKTLCAAVIVEYHGERLFGTCSPSSSKQNACLAEVTIPALYWPPLDVSNGGLYAAKQQKSSTAKVYYTIAHTAAEQACNDQNFLSLLAASTEADEGEGGQNGEVKGEGEPAAVADLAAAAAHMNLVYLSDVSLVPFRGSYEEVTNDNVVTVLIPQEPVYPNSKIYIPVKYTYNPDYPVAAFSLRVQVKSGLKILGAQLSHPNKLWQLSVELGAKQTTATVTAFLRDYIGTVSDQQNSGQFGQQSDNSGQSQLPDELLENSSQEVYSWLIEVEGDIDISEVNGRIVWQLLYNTDAAATVEARQSGGQADMQAQQSQQAQEDEDFERESVKLTSLIDIQKDVVAEILAITKSLELLNTAILNGRQVSRTMRVYQVSAAGSISDITFQCSCQSADESIIKVSPSCTSVYLDGSEVRGSQNASILIKYGSFTGLGNFIVWMPLIPLDVRVADSKLSQIKGWRVPFYLPKRLANPFAEFNENTESRFDFLDQQMLMDAERSSISEADKYAWTASASVAAGAGSGTSSSNGNSGCRLRFQQTRVEVYTRFLSTDHNSGREASLLNRRHSLRITHLVRNLIRVTDSKVLRIRAGGSQVEGVGVGRADVEVISPLTGSVIGSREVTVTSDREAISRMEVRPVSGLKLQVEPLESSVYNIWTTSVELNSRLTKQYQEALLDARLLFTDGTWVSLSELSPADYDLSVDTFKGVVAHVSRVNGARVSSSSSSGVGVHHSNFNGLSSAHHELPRIIALLPGQGELVHLTLDLPYACQRKKSQPLVSAYVNIDVHFQLPEEGQHASSLQNDAINGYRGRQHNINDTISKVGSKDGFRLMGGGLLKKRPNSLLSSRRNGLYPNHQSAAEERERITYQRHSGNSPGSGSSLGNLAQGPGTGSVGVGGSHFEFGMYSLLTVVSVASIIVVVLYSVFSLRNFHDGGKGDSQVTTTATSENGVGKARQFLSCVNSGASSGHQHRHHRGYHQSSGAQVTNAAKEWIWVGGNNFDGGSSRCGGAIRQPQEMIGNETNEEMLEMRRPLLPIHQHHFHHQHHHRNHHHPHCTDHNGNLTTLTEATKGNTGNSSLELEQFNSGRVRTRMSSTAHDRQDSSSGSTGGGFRITANPAETLLTDSEQFDLEQSEKLDELASQRQQQQCTIESSSTLQSLLIPMNHKSTRIKTSSGLSFLAGSPDEPPPPIPARTRHIPLPSSSNSSCARRTIGAGNMQKGPPIWRHHHQQQHPHHQPNWQLTGEQEQLQCELANTSRATSRTATPPPVPPHRRGQRGSNSSESGSDLSTGSSSTHSHSVHPPPVPPHQNSGSSRSSRTLSSASSTSACEHSPQPVRPKHLRLAKRHAPQQSSVHSNTLVGNAAELQQQPLDYRSMMKVLERLKESSA